MLWAQRPARRQLLRQLRLKNVVSEACLNPREEAYSSVCVCVHTCTDVSFVCVGGGGVYLIRTEVGLSVRSPSPARCAMGSQRILELLDAPERCQEQLVGGAAFGWMDSGTEIKDRFSHVPLAQSG